jgi:hypothetical protein
LRGKTDIKIATKSNGRKEQHSMTHDELVQKANSIFNILKWEEDFLGIPRLSWHEERKKIERVVGAERIIGNMDCYTLAKVFLRAINRQFKPRTGDPEKLDDHFGLCPVCHRTDGFANAWKSHVFYCKEHKTLWFAGSNLFSSWRDQTEEEQRRIWKEIGLDEFEYVEPYHHPRPATIGDDTELPLNTEPPLNVDPALCTPETWNILRGKADAPANGKPSTARPHN